jgi:DNA-binding transcriptional ArsR family regulator
MVLEDIVFKAISHPVRREIIGLLATAPRSVKELTAQFEMSQPEISQHLRELKTADLVTSERIGLEQHYRLTPEPLRYILHWSDAYRHLVDPSGHVWTFTAAKNRGKKVRSKGEIQNGR